MRISIAGHRRACTLAGLLTLLAGCTSSPGFSAFGGSSGEPSTAAPPALAWGANGHPAFGGSPNPDYGGVGAVTGTVDDAFTNQIETLRRRGLTRYRIGIVPSAPNLGAQQANNAANVSAVGRWIAIAGSHGVQISLNAMMEYALAANGVPFTVASAVDPTLYARSFSIYYAFFNQFSTAQLAALKDIEINNETDLHYACSSAEPSCYDYGFVAAEWDNIPFYQNYAFVFRGQTDAIDQINRERGLALRKVLNFTQSHFGFALYMQAQGVNFDVVSYHTYVSAGTSNAALAGGGHTPGGAAAWNVFDALAALNRPVKLNETNCGEVYAPGFQNTSNDPLLTTCLRSLHASLKEWTNATQIKLEEIDIYELYDEPSLTGYESRFGLMFSSGGPNYSYSAKPTLLLTSYLAGGTLTAAELATLRAYIPDL